MNFLSIGEIPATNSCTLLIQRTEHRDTQALQAKLDELLQVHGQANNAPEAILTRDEFKALAWTTANARARKMGWIV